MAYSVSHKAERAGEDSVKVAKDKSRRVRNRLATDKELRDKVVLGAVSAVAAAAVAVGSWFIYKKRDQIKKKLKETKSEIEKKMGHGHSAPAATK